MIRPLRRDVIQQFLGQIAVRVNDPDPMPQRDVLQNQISQQGGFSSAGFTDDVEMLPLIHGGNAKGLGIAPAKLLANDDVGVLVVHGARTGCVRELVVGVITPDPKTRPPTCRRIGR